MKQLISYYDGMIFQYDAIASCIFYAMWLPCFFNAIELIFNKSSASLLFFVNGKNNNIKKNSGRSAIGY